MSQPLLFSSSEPVKDHVIASKLPDTIDTNEVMKEISEFYKDRGIECLRISDSWAFRTSKDVSDYLDVDRPLYPDHTKMKELVKTGEILEEIENLVGSLE